MTLISKKYFLEKKSLLSPHIMRTKKKGREGKKYHPIKLLYSLKPHIQKKTPLERGKIFVVI